MLRLISLCFWLVLFSLHFNGVKAQFVPQTPYNTSVSSPEWVKMMYSDSEDRAAVRSAYEDYYKVRPLVKNKDTQFYKRWMRNGDVPAPSMSTRYQNQHAEAGNRMTGV